MSSAEAETAAEVATDRPCTGSCDRRVVAGIMGQGSPLFTVRQLDRSAVYLFDVHFLGGSQSTSLTTTKAPKQRCKPKIFLCIRTKLEKTVHSASMLILQEILASFIDANYDSIKPYGCSYSCTSLIRSDCIREKEAAQYFRHDSRKYFFSSRYAR